MLGIPTRRKATQSQAAAGARFVFSSVLIVVLGLWLTATRIVGHGASSATEAKNPSGTHQAMSADLAEDQSIATAAAANPQLVKDINPGDASSTPEMFVTFGNAIYFRANDRTHGVELWRTDGTAEGTTLVADLFPGPSNGVPGSLTVAADGLFFHGFTEPTA